MQKSKTNHKAKQSIVFVVVLCHVGERLLGRLRLRSWRLDRNLGSATTTLFYGRVGSLPLKSRKILVVSVGSCRCFGRVFGRFLVVFVNHILKNSRNFSAI